MANESSPELQPAAAPDITRSPDEFDDLDCHAFGQRVVQNLPGVFSPNLAHPSMDWCDGE